MNCIEQHLPELELSTGQVREALQCILHTILFIRSPGPVTPCDVECEGFNITYTRIAQDKKDATTTSAGAWNTTPNSPPPSGVSSPRIGRVVGTVTNKNGNNLTSSPSSPSRRQLQQRQQQQHEPHDVERKVDEAIESFLRSLTQVGPELLSGCLTLSFFERRATRQLFGLVSHEEKVIFEQWILRVVVNNTPRPICNDSASVIERQRIQDTAEGMLRTALMKVYEITGGSVDHVPPVMYDFDVSCTKRADDRENMYSRVTNMPPILNLTGS